MHSRPQTVLARLPQISSTLMATPTRPMLHRMRSSIRQSIYLIIRAACRRESRDFTACQVCVTDADVVCRDVLRIRLGPRRHVGGRIAAGIVGDAGKARRPGVDLK